MWDRLLPTKMKTLFKRSKYYLGLGFALLIVFSGFMTVSGPAPQALAWAGCGQAQSGTQAELPASIVYDSSQYDKACDGIPAGCPGAEPTAVFVSGTVLNCPYYPAIGDAGSAWRCDHSICKFPGGGETAKNQPAPRFDGYCTPTSAPYTCPSFMINTLSPNALIYCTPSTTNNYNCPAGSVPLSQGFEPATDPDEETSVDSSTGCDFGGNPLTWIICPIVGMLESLIRQVDNFIMTSLDFNTKEVFGDTSKSPTDPANKAAKGYKIAWSSFRVIATLILLLAGLIMVISQALGFEFLDAYTIKKTLPKLLLAALFINLSWIGMRFVIEFFNTMGVNVRELIYGPFSGPEFDGTLGGSTLFLANVGAIAGLVFLGPMALLSFLVTGALAVLVGFIIIIVRNLALIVIIMFAPIAIACWVLPNTQKIWNLWKDNFIGLLFVFPIISAFIAIGRVFSAVSLQGGTSEAGGAGTISQVVGFVAYFLPYFLLPIAFRLATGVIGTVAGFVNDRNRGAFDKLKKFRGAEAARNTAALKAGSRYNPDSKWTKVLGGRAINRTGAHVGAGVRGKFGFGATGAAARGNNAYATADSLSRENHAFAAQVNNEDAMAAVALGNDRRKLEQLTWFRNADNTVNESKISAALAAGRSIGSDQRTQVAALDALAQSGKVINSREELKKVLDWTSHGNSALRGGLKGQYQFTSRKVGRADIGRDTAEESLRELSMSGVASLKPRAAANLFGINPDTGRNDFDDAVANAGSKEEAQHLHDVLYAAQFSSYIAPEQQASIARLAEKAEKDPQTKYYWAVAKDNYSRKQRESGSDDSDTIGARTGGPPGPIPNN